MGFAKYLTLAVVTSTFAACSKEGTRQAPAAHTAGSAVAAAVGDAGAAAPADAAVVTLDALAGPQRAELPAVDDVPTLTLARVPAAKLASSKKLNTEGYKLHAAKNVAGAAEKYRAALLADPGNLLARYNLASAAVSSGDAARGLAILAMFDVPDCRACVGILNHAKADPEWTSVHGTAAFVDITAKAAPDQPDLAAIAARLRPLVVGNGTVDGLEPYFHPRQPVSLTENGIEFARVSSPTELQAWGKQAKASGEPYVRVMELIECRGNCCEMRWDPTECESGCGSDLAYDFDRVCFGGVGDVWFIEKLNFYHYMTAGP